MRRVAARPNRAEPAVPEGALTAAVGTAHSNCSCKPRGRRRRAAHAEHPGCCMLTGGFAGGVFRTPAAGWTQRAAETGRRAERPPPTASSRPSGTSSQVKRPTAALPMGNPYCSCRLTRVRRSAGLAALPAHRLALLSGSIDRPAKTAVRTRRGGTGRVEGHPPPVAILIAAGRRRPAPPRSVLAAVEPADFRSRFSRSRF